MTKCQDKNVNILRRERALEVNEKAFFIIFKELSVAKNCLGPESAPLSKVAFHLSYKSFKIQF